MKILFVTPPPYLPNRLHRIRSFQLIQMLTQRHEVFFLGVTTEKKEPKEFAKIRKLCKSVEIIHLSPMIQMLMCVLHPDLPLEVAYCYSPKINRKIKEIVQDKKIDLIYVKRLRAALYISDNRLPKVIDTTDAMSMFYDRLAKLSSFPKNKIYKLEAKKYTLFEKKIMKQFKNWIVCSEIDRQYLNRLSKKTNFFVIPNSVDTNYYRYRRSKLENNTILFRGLMDKRVNIDAIMYFVNEIFPLVRKSIPNSKLYVVGPNPIKAIRNLRKKTNIVVTEYVNDVRQYIQKTDLGICPVRIGSGTRNKILQSWAMEKPVVSTTIGAEGLFYEHEKNILIADTPEDFANNIIQLLKNKKLYNKIGSNGRKTVKKYYSNNAVSETLGKTIRSIVKTYEKN